MTTSNPNRGDEASIRAAISELEARKRELNDLLTRDGCVTDSLRTELASMDHDLRRQVDLLARLTTLGISAVS